MGIAAHRVLARPEDKPLLLVSDSLRPWPPKVSWARIESCPNLLYSRPDPEAFAPKACRHISCIVQYCRESRHHGYHAIDQQQLPIQYSSDNNRKSMKHPFLNAPGDIELSDGAGDSTSSHFLSLDKQTTRQETHHRIQNARLTRIKRCSLVDSTIARTQKLPYCAQLRCL